MPPVSYISLREPRDRAEPRESGASSKTLGMLLTFAPVARGQSRGVGGRCSSQSTVSSVELCLHLCTNHCIIKRNNFPDNSRKTTVTLVTFQMHPCNLPCCFPHLFIYILFACITGGHSHKVARKAEVKQED